MERTKKLETEEFALTQYHLEFLTVLIKTPGIPQMTLEDIAYNINSWRTIGLIVSQEDIISWVFEINKRISDIMHIFPAGKDIFVRLKVDREVVSKMIRERKEQMKSRE